MNYSDLVSTGAFVVAGISLIWQCYTWYHVRRKEEKPLLKVYLCRKISVDMKGKQNENFSFNIENVGSIGVTILEVKISDIDIAKCGLPIIAPEQIIGASLPERNIASCPWVFLMQMDQRLLPGNPVKVKCKTDSGATYSSIYTLNEAN